MLYETEPGWFKKSVSIQSSIHNYRWLNQLVDTNRSTVSSVTISSEDHQQG